MRSARGIQLVEMLVAVGLSGIFVVLLSGMLSQTLRFATASENQILAGATADQIVELIQHQNLSGNLAETSPNPTYQLDVNRDAFGIFSNGSLDLSKRWTDTSGNQFKGTVTVQSTRTALDNLPCTIYNVVVAYPSETGGTKSVTRTTCIFDDGATF
ncbi:MAG: hypothetical protein EKK48_03605 [Candidatus Melainabacteria bacterium]|nr:MAG: hypothetical protein EKK48_03605 [Candidatus Melainabacteria bacterium]